MSQLDDIFRNLQTAWDQGCLLRLGPSHRSKIERAIAQLECGLPEGGLEEAPYKYFAGGIVAASRATRGKRGRWHPDSPLVRSITQFLQVWVTTVEGVRIDSWRELPRDRLLRLRREYRDLLLARTNFADNARDDAWTAAHSDRSAADLVIAEKLKQEYGPNHRLIYPWLALAGLGTSDASRMAGLLVGAHLAREKETIHLAAGWLTPFGDLAALGVRSPGWAQFASPPRQLLEAERKSMEKPRPIGTPNLDNYVASRHGDAMTVAKSLGALDGEEGKQIARTWSFLTRPLGLARGPAPDLLASALSIEFPWLTEAIDAIVGDLRLRQAVGMGWAHWRPILLVGPPGTGKTRFARRLAEFTGAGFGEINAGGSTDNRALQGTSRGWSTASPSYVLHVMRQSMTANPVMLVDEIDKVAAGSSNGDVRATLLGMLEPLSAKAWPDECLMAPVDLSAVNWILVANDPAPLRGPLLTRLRVIEAPLPTPEHFPAVLHAIRRDIAMELRVDPTDLADLAPEAEARLKAAFAKGYSLRRIRSAVEGAIKVGGGIAREGRAH